MEAEKNEASVVCVGDTVRDPMDRSLRKVVRIEDGTLYMADGGLMGADEVREVWLESEAPR